MPIDIERCSPFTLLTTGETAELLRLSQASVRRYALDGRIRAVPGVGKLLFTAAAVRSFLSGGLPASTSAADDEIENPAGLQP